MSENSLALINEFDVNLVDYYFDILSSKYVRGFHIAYGKIDDEGTVSVIEENPFNHKLISTVADDGKCSTVFDVKKEHRNLRIISTNREKINLINITDNKVYNIISFTIDDLDVDDIVKVTLASGYVNSLVGIFIETCVNDYLVIIKKDRNTDDAPFPLVVIELTDIITDEYKFEFNIYQSAFSFVSENNSFLINKIDDNTMTLYSTSKDEEYKLPLTNELYKEEEPCQVMIEYNPRIVFTKVK